MEQNLGTEQVTEESKVEIEDFTPENVLKYQADYLSELERKVEEDAKTPSKDYSAAIKKTEEIIVDRIKNFSGGGNSVIIPMGVYTEFLTDESWVGVIAVNIANHFNTKGFECTYSVEYGTVTIGWTAQSQIAVE